jgi:antitoxin PrlF
MTNQKDERSSCAGAGGQSGACCRVESLISVDERGQMVLPKELREKAGIAPGDKLAAVSWEKGGRICCLFLIKADDMAGYVKDFLGPLMGDIAGK